MANEEIRRAVLPPTRADYRRHGTGVRRSRIRREKVVFVLCTAKKTATDHFVQKVGLLGTFYTILFGFLQVEGKTNPCKAIFLVSLCICASAVGFEISVVRNMFGSCAADHITNRAILLSGALGMVPIVSIILPAWLSWFIYVMWGICSLMVMAWNLNLLKRFKQRFLINAASRTLVEPQGPTNV